MRIRNLLGRMLKGPPTPAPSDEVVLAPLPEPFRATLLAMYREESRLGSDGQRHAVNPLTRILPSQGMWFYDLCCSLKSRATLEIGFAYGFSALFFLAGAAKNGAGRHTAIDPFEVSHWHGIGLANIGAADAESSFRLISDRSDHAATDLARQNSSFDIIFIDGNHRFDDALVDFYLYAPLCKVEGLIIFDDMWMNSIQTVVSFVRANRPDFVEVATHQPNVSAFRRVGEDLRLWDYFQPFRVADSTRVRQ
jgi:predicted O-methyltransferase YrrM